MTAIVTDLTPIATLVEEYRQAVTEKAKWDKKTRQLSPLLKEVIGEHEYGVVNGVNVLKRQVLIRSTFDIARFAEDFPDLAQRYMTEERQVRLTLVKDAASD